MLKRQCRTTKGVRKDKRVEGIGVGVVVITGAGSAGKDVKTDAKTETKTDTEEQQ